jgi:hypothetical protein
VTKYYFATGNIFSDKLSDETFFVTIYQVICGKLGDETFFVTVYQVICDKILFPH